MFLNCKRLFVFMVFDFVFSSEERVKLLVFLLNNPGKELSVRGIARELGLSPAFVSAFIKKLRKEGLVGKKIRFFDPRIKALKILLNVKQLFEAKIVEVFLREFPAVKGIGFYGSWANGLNYVDSDLDLWVKVVGRTDERKLLNVVRAIKKKLGVQPNILVLTPEKINNLREKDFVFYCSLVNSFLLWGEQID